MTYGKRGQMAIFVIVAITIVVLIALFFFFRENLPGVFQAGLSPRSFLSACVEPEIKANVALLSKYGGYKNPDRFALYKGEKVQYLCYTDANYKTCVVQQPMIKQNFENQLNEAVEGRARECMQNLINEYEKRGYRVTAGRIDSQTSLAPSKILIKFNTPLSVTKETSESFDGFDVEINSEIYDLVFIAQSIIEYEAKLGDSASELYLQYYPNLKIEKSKLDDGTKIYKLSNVITKEEFSFASRSLAWPPGYGLEEL